VWLDRVEDRLVAARNRTDRTLVNEPHRFKWYVARCAAGYVTTWVLILTVKDGDPDHWWPSGLATIALGIIIGWNVLGATIGRIMTYRNGWVDGRLAMAATLTEAARRGMSPAEWLASEMARTVAVFGVPPSDPTDTDG
jgi:hypothetical protein